jgi:phage baseplate assembly protein W
MAKSISIKYPFNNDNSKNTFLETNKTTIDDIKSSINFFFTTRKGIRWYKPDFGTGLYEILFDKNDAITVREIENLINAELNNYFPSLTINELNILQNEDNNSIIININFNYNGLNDIVNIGFGV